MSIASDLSIKPVSYVCIKYSKVTKNIIAHIIVSIYDKKIWIKG